MPTDNQLLSAWYLALTTAGLAGYALVFGSMWKHHKAFDNQPFYILLWHLAFGDVGILVEQLVVAIPLTYTATPIYGDGLFYLILTGADTLFFYQIHWMNFVIALNRLLCFAAPTTYTRFFGKHRSTRCMALLTWVMGVQWLTLSSLIGCPKKFNHHFSFYYYDCAPLDNVTAVQQFIRRAHMTHVVLTPVVSFIGYCILYQLIRRKTGAVVQMISNNEYKLRIRQERSLLYQGGIICAVLLLEIVLFELAPSIVTVSCERFSRCSLATPVIGGMVIVNSAINPYIYLVFNSAVRDSVISFIRFRKQSGARTTQKRTKRNAVSVAVATVAPIRKTPANVWMTGGMAASISVARLPPTMDKPQANVTQQDA